jgi:hypothetical protein
LKNDPIQKALEILDDPGADLGKALLSKHSLVAAKAARMIGEAERRDLAESVATALGKLLTAPAAADKGCSAKIAMARALNKLEYDDAGLFLKGMKHIQLEPVWGGSEDTAADLRAVCAMGLAGSTYFHKLREIVWLMADKEWPARCGAIRAIAACGGDSAALLLRLKALTGDKVDEVMSDCYTALLAVEGASAVPLVVSLAPRSEAATLALGASRLAEAIEALKELFSRTADPESRRSILLSLATARTESAIEFLIGLIGDAAPQTAAAGLRAIAIHRADAKIRDLVSRAIQSREDSHLDPVFFEAFNS